MARILLTIALLTMLTAGTQAQENTALTCADGLDNDGNGLIDCLDPACQALPNEGCSTCFADGASFADEVLFYGNPCPDNVRIDSSQALGVSDYTSALPNDGYVSLGNQGVLRLGFTDNRLTNSGDTEADLWVFEIGPNVEASVIALHPVEGTETRAILIEEGIAEDTAGYFLIGVIEGSTSSVDLDGLLSEVYPAGTLSFDAVQITDNNTRGCRAGDTTPGADIDAVCALSSISCDTTSTTVSQTICRGDSLEGYTATGVYRDTFALATGCDSIRVLDLTVTADSCTTSTRLLDISKQIGVFPNPASGSFTIDLPEGLGKATATLYDLTGRQVRSSALPLPNFDTRGIPAGMYLLVVSNGEFRGGKMIILE